MKKIQLIAVLTFWATAVLAQSDFEQTLQSSCERCAKFKNEGNLDAYAKANCRILENLCPTLSTSGGGGGPIIIGSDDTISVASAAGEVAIQPNSTIKVVFILENFQTTASNLRPVFSVMTNKTSISVENSKFLEVYVFDAKGNLISMAGKEFLEEVSPKQKVVVVQTLNIGSTAAKVANVRVQLNGLNGKREEKTLKTYLKKVRVGAGK